MEGEKLQNDQINRYHKIETDIILVDKNGNVITVETPQPEIVELWV